MSTTAAPPPAKETLDQKPDLQWVPIGLIVPSTTNPRVQRSAERDAELLESVKERGVVQAGLLRPVTATRDHVRLLESFSSPTMGISKLKAEFGPGDAIFQVVGGQRRWEASVKSGKTEYPAQVRCMADHQVLEYQIIENDDREDLDDMDRAVAYKRLFDEWKKDTSTSITEKITQLALKMKRKPRAVWNIYSLGNLSAQGQKMLRDGVISKSHAYEIAPRSAAQQKKILDWFEEESRYGDPISVRDLKEYIRDECDHYLDTAPFPREDVSLLAGAGACTKCPKNSAVNLNLVDVEEGKKTKTRAICTDAECWKQKVHNNLVRIELALKKSGAEPIRVSSGYEREKGVKTHDEWKQVKAGSCQYAVVGILVDEGKGDQIHVCAMTNICKIHWVGKSDFRGTGSDRPPVSRPRSESEKKAMLQKQRNKKLDQAYRTAATAALRKGVTQLKTEDLREVARQMIYMTDRRHRNPIFAAMGWKTSESFYGPPIPIKQIEALKPADVAAFIALMTVASKVLPELEGYWPETHVPLEPFAKRHKLDLAKIQTTATKPLREKFAAIDAKKKKAALQTSAKKKKGKAA